MTVGALCRGCGAFLQQRTPSGYGPCCERSSPEARRRAIYRSKRWRKTSATVIARDGERCVDCHRHRSELAEHETLLADHVAGVLEEHDPYDPDVCRTRCSTCSGRKDGARGT